MHAIKLEKNFLSWKIAKPTHFKLDPDKLKAAADGQSAN